MANYTDPENKLPGVTICAQNLFKQIVADAPATYTTSLNTYTVTIEITSGYRTVAQNDQVGGSKTSPHLKKLAIDVRIKLDGVVVSYPGSYRTGYSKTPPLVKLGNDSIDAYNLYRTVLASSIAKNRCIWGGNSGRFDPIHIGFSPCTLNDQKMSDVEEDITYLTTEPTNEDSLNIDAGDQSVEQDSSTTGSLINYDKTQLYIGYGLFLSNIQNNKNGLTYIDNLLKYANVDDEVKTKIEALTGLSGQNAYTKYLTDVNISITSQQADAIFLQQLDILRKELETKGFKFAQYPKEISTAIVSYFFGKNTGSEKSSKDIILLLTLVNQSLYDDIASFFEQEAVNVPNDIKQKRLSEASLVRSYKATNEISPEFLIKTTSNPVEYENNLPEIRYRLANQLTQLNKIFSTSKTSPASEEYDEMFNDIDVSTITAVAAMMQSQQVNYDTYFGTLDDDYTRRLKIKNLYTILARYLNYNISSVDNLLQSNKILENKNDYSLAEMYDIVPFSQNLGYIVKNNAVRRCELRIRILEKKIKDKEGELYSTGLPDISSWSSILIFLSTLWIRMSVVAISNLTSLIESLFSELAVLKEQHRLEKNNLKNLVKDRNRYRYA